MVDSQLNLPDRLLTELIVKMTAVTRGEVKPNVRKVQNDVGHTAAGVTVNCSVWKEVFKLRNEVQQLVGFM